MMTIIEHVYLDISLVIGHDRVSLRFGPDLSDDDIPTDGEVIRVDGRLYEVGMMDTSDPPLLHQTDIMPECGLWWDADDAGSVATPASP